MGSTPVTSKATVGVGLVGFGWMGRVHARAYARVPHHYSDLQLLPRLVAVADSMSDRNDDAVSRYGFERQHLDWRELRTISTERSVWLWQTPASTSGSRNR